MNLLNGYDFEVYRYDWLVVIINPIEQTKTVIINDRDKLEQFHGSHKDQIWIGYNSRSYDQYILKAILLGMDPKAVNDWIILKHRKGWEYSSLFNKIPLYNYDCMDKFRSLKELEGFMGNDIRETSVPFDIDRKLTEQELDDTVRYCTHDVEQTLQVFLQTKASFDAHLNLLNTFHLPLSSISKTQAQLSAMALGCVRKDWTDEWNLRFVDTLQLGKYEHVKKWFMDPANHDYSKSLKTNVCGVPHVFGWGGIHGAPDEPLYRTGLLLHVDVTSYYPSIMIRYDMLSRNVKDKDVYKQIYDTRVALKKAGKKAEQAPYKIILNSTYGICKDPSSAAYDPLQANNVCVNGQLLLLDLLWHLEDLIDLIQSNTDGLIIAMPERFGEDDAVVDKWFDTVDDICYEWEQRTGMGLGFDVIKGIYQKDVNNYLFQFEDGKIERKGAWLKELNNLDYDLPIVNEALVAYMTKGIPVERTIRQCNDLIKFQKIVKVSSKYMCGWHNGRKLTDKTYRVFASTDPHDTYIGKVKIKNGKASVEKFGNTPEHCFYMNCSVNGLPAPDNLDKQWYIDLAKKRLTAFGVK